jgi:serine/threonine protein kinase
MSQGAAPVTEPRGGTSREGPASTALAMVGATLEGAYDIRRLIAEGGMSAVYEAVQLRLSQRVAVKVLARELASNQEALARFRREAEITSRLRHPHLVTVMDFGTGPDGQPFLVMEYLDGIDLDRRIRAQGGLPLPAVVNITKQVASALAAAHEQGIVHRDLKPANVFLVALPDEPDFVKLLDFGISKVRAANTQLTKASSIIGTPNYMSPEQATGMIDEIDHRTDQWALACIVWEMLAGRPPFASDDMSAVFYQVIHLEPQPLSKRRPDLPAAVEAVLRRALSKSATDRFSTIRDFAGALADAASRGHGISSGSLPTWAGGGGTSQSSPERRRARQERRRVPSALDGSPAPGRSSSVELRATAEASFGRRLKPLYLLPVLLVLVGFAAALLLRPTQPVKVLPPPAAVLAPLAVPIASAPAAAKAAPLAPPPAATAEEKPLAKSPTHKQAAREARDVRDTREPRHGARDPVDPFEPSERAARQPNPTRAVDEVDPDDPFAPRRPAHARGTTKSKRVDSDFVDPFAL